MSQNQIPVKFIKKAPFKLSKSHSVPIKFNHPSQCVVKKIQKLIQKTNVNKQSFQINKQELPNFIVLGRVKKQIFCIFHPILKLYGSVDQHAMHQRIRYEYYIKILQGQSVSNFIHRNIQKNSVTNNIQVINSQKHKKLLYVCKNDQYLHNNQLTLSKYGIKLQINQNNDIYCVQYHPILNKALQDETLKQICTQILQNNKIKSNKIAETLDYIIAQHSCKNAIKFGDQVNDIWCKQLLHNASLCLFPWRCVHGRQSVYFTWYDGREKDEGRERNYCLQ